MAIIDTFKIDNTPDASRIWKEMGSSFSNLSQALCEFVDDAVSNFRGNKEDESLRRIVRILVEQQENAVDIVVEDGGTGIRNVANAMTLAGVEEQETPLNEHGYGLKHALSYVEGSGSDWEVFTRTAEAAALGQSYAMRAPYVFGHDEYPIEIHDDWPGTLGTTGTVIRFRCPMNVFATLEQSGKHKEIPFDRLMAILKEHLRYTYAAILEAGEMGIEVITKAGENEMREMLVPLLPSWEDGSMVDIPKRKVNLGGGSLQVSCRYGRILPSKQNFCHYLGNMESSGVELRINGRVIEHGLLKTIWGRKVHNSQNAFLAQVDLTTESLEAIPATKTAKNGFREEDPRLQELFKWIRANVQLPENESESKEQKMFRKLAEKKAKLPGMTRVSLEEATFRTIGLRERMDMFTCQNDQVTIYEGKVRGTKASDVYQLKMYWDGCIQDGVPADEGVLVGGRHPKEVYRLIQHVNSTIGPDGRPYHFQLTTWKEEGITCA